MKPSLSALIILAMALISRPAIADTKVVYGNNNTEAMAVPSAVNNVAKEAIAVNCPIALEKLVDHKIVTKVFEKFEDPKSEIEIYTLVYILENQDKDVDAFKVRVEYLPTHSDDPKESQGEAKALNVFSTRLDCR